MNCDFHFVFHSFFQSWFETNQEKKWFIDFQNRKIVSLSPIHTNEQPTPNILITNEKGNNPDFVFDRYHYLAYSIFHPQNSIIHLYETNLNDLPPFLTDFEKSLAKGRKHSQKKEDLLPTQSWNQKNSPFFAILFQVEPSWLNRFYEPSLIIANIFNSGGWISPWHKSKNLKQNYDLLALGYKRYNHIKKEIHFINNHFYYSIKVILNKSDHKEHVFIRDLFYSRLRELKNANRDDLELIRNANNSVSDFMLRYEKEDIYKYCATENIDISTFFDSVKLMLFYDKGHFMRIASSYFSDSMFMILSDNDLSITMDEFEIMKGY